MNFVIQSIDGFDECLSCFKFCTFAYWLCGICVSQLWNTQITQQFRVRNLKLWKCHSCSIRSTITLSSHSIIIECVCVFILLLLSLFFVLFFLKSRRVFYQKTDKKQFVFAKICWSIVIAIASMKHIHTHTHSLCRHRTVIQQILWQLFLFTFLMLLLGFRFLPVLFFSCLLFVFFFSLVLSNKMAALFRCAFVLSNITIVFHYVCVRFGLIFPFEKIMHMEWTR